MSILAARRCTLAPRLSCSGDILYCPTTSISSITACSSRVISAMSLLLLGRLNEKRNSCFWKRC